jgi:diaminohydroxyphosphoribosylaminopyrimidine deaminase / 5-amino-6-(5-phosphoribosylamino)uracil reductase
VRPDASADLVRFMRQALRLAERGYGGTSPNPMVGAVLIKNGRVIGRGWHKKAGGPHAEIAALREAARRGTDPRGATLYVTLEPCSTHGRTPPCTAAICAAAIRRVVAAATDPNPAHAGRGFGLLRRAGIEVIDGVLRDEATRLNEAFNHWIVHRTPFITVKAAMSLDGKIATATGESKWITSPASRNRAMKFRQGADAILVGINTVLRDNPGLTVRLPAVSKVLHRIVMDSRARTPLTSQVVSDKDAPFTTVVVGEGAPTRQVAALERKVRVWRAPECEHGMDVRWVIEKLGQEEITSLLVEGGGVMNASFLLGGFAHRIAFFYAPMIIGGAQAARAVAGDGILDAAKGLRLSEVEWERLGPDLLLTARLENQSNGKSLCSPESSKKQQRSRPSARPLRPSNLPLRRRSPPKA